MTVVTLEMTDPRDIRPAPTPLGATLTRVLDDVASASRRMYRDVGAAWHWVDRADWPAASWQTWADRPELHHLRARQADEPVGYVEIEQQPDGVAEIAYFGLLPGYPGRGLGGWLLTAALEYAWTLPGTRRVWVHTCDLDGPGALPNYLARGLREVGRAVEWRLVAGDTVPT